MIDSQYPPERWAPTIQALAAPERVAWAIEQFGSRAALTSSFGAQSAVLLHLATRVAPRIPVYFINTGFLFTETIAFKESLEAALGLEIHELRPRIPRDEFLRMHGELYRTDPDACCKVNKVDVLQSAIDGVDCWLSGLRQAQSDSRAATPVLEVRRDGRLKLNPLADWSDSQVEDYLETHGLPVHPLSEQGYLSIGCEPCTSRPQADGDARSGRWAGREKTECGIHFL